MTAATLLGRLSARFWSVSVGICAHSAKRAFVRSGTDVGRESLAHNRHSMGLRSGLCAGQSSSSTPNSSNHVFMDLALCTGAQSCCSSMTVIRSLIRPSDCQIVKRDSSLQRTRFHCSSVQLRHTLHQSKRRLALRMVM